MWAVQLSRHRRRLIIGPLPKLNETGISFGRCMSHGLLCSAHIPPGRIGTVAHTCVTALVVS
jgi:hypothetical protein